ncbi:MAG: NAD(P) transhydrogenase subunit alpha part 1 [Fimbriimonadaceae bacterium]|nr:NAD(P) transhydrogenase subunit alpha part 1 [Fimbriimonadaceae bacterium]
MIIAVPKETSPGERRVALSPEGVKSLVSENVKVNVEAGAGDGAFFADKDYADVGATICGGYGDTVGNADLVLKVTPPIVESGEVAGLRKGSALISFLFPISNPPIVHALAEAGIDAFAMDLMPRISRAQVMDALSSMSTIGGYKASLLAADHVTRFFPMLMTAAGTMPPARVFVLGAGVAGLQAIATCKRLGAIVEAFDVRPAVKEQVESLGGKFIGMSLLSEEAEDVGGYAKEVTGDTHAKELELIASRLPQSDAVITTALIPGKRAPILITNDMLERMKPGSVVVDLAAPAGGNCEATVPGEVVQHNGVSVVGRVDLISSMASDASKMYSKNLTAFLALLIKEGKLEWDMEDEIVKGTLVTHEGKIVHDVTRLALQSGGGA